MMIIIKNVAPPSLMDAALGRAHLAEMFSLSDIIENIFFTFYFTVH